MNDQTPTPITDVITIGVPVTDQDRALEFYRDKLGFEMRRDAPLPQAGRWIEVAPPGARITLALVPSTEGVPAGVQTGIRLATGDAVALHADLEAAPLTSVRCCVGPASHRCSRCATRTAIASRSSKPHNGRTARSRCARGGDRRQEIAGAGRTRRTRLHVPCRGR